MLNSNNTRNLKNGQLANWASQQDYGTQGIISRGPVARAYSSQKSDTVSSAEESNGGAGDHRAHERNE